MFQRAIKLLAYCKVGDDFKYLYSKCICIIFFLKYKDLLLFNKLKY